MIEANDGVAVAFRGDLVISLWQSPARLHRSRWFFDIVDRAVAKYSSVAILQIILPTSKPPDAPTRAENSARLRKLGKAIRRVVTVPSGDALFLSVVRTIMRAMFVIQGQSHLQFVESWVTTGIRRVLEQASPNTPDRSQIEADVAALYMTLGVKLPGEVVVSQAP